MVDVKEALHIIRKQSIALKTEIVELDSMYGRVLAEDWISDRPFPPFHRVMMDGIAIAYNVFETGQQSFIIERTVAAGSDPGCLSDSSNCLEIMTGAVLPEGVDTVIRYEDVTIKDGVAFINPDEVQRGQNIHNCGEDRLKGDLLVSKGSLIGHAELGIAASIGKYQCTVFQQVKVLVLSTGDELVEVNEQPKSYQIRRSNVYSIESILQNCVPQCNISLEHINDSEYELEHKLSSFIHEYDFLVLSGGVSKGKFDFVPVVLERLGVEKGFHGVFQRPGKPFWFGYTDNCTVFALPGNPISSFVCTLKYIQYWLHQHFFGVEPFIRYAILGTDVIFKPDLTYFLEVKLNCSVDGRIIATPQKGNGSGDLANLTFADGFIELPRGRNEFKKGEIFPILEFRIGNYGR